MPKEIPLVKAVRESGWRIDSLLKELRSHVQPFELGWLAGIIDGEGCVNVHRAKRPPSGWYHRLYLIVVNCDPRIVNRCQEIANAILGKSATYVYKKRERIKPNHSQIYRWECGGEVAALLLAVLRPLLVGKQEQADIAIKFQDAIRASKGLMSAVRRYGEYALSNADIEQRDVLYQEIRRLNGRGPQKEARLAVHEIARDSET